MDKTAKTLPEDNLLDVYNRQLQSLLHPDDRKNPIPEKKYNLVILGAGPAGLVAAAGAAGLGAKVALVERGFMGGDCLNVGCVPSKALIRCGRAMADVSKAKEFGIKLPGTPQLDFTAVMERMHRLRTELAEHDSVDRFTRLGVDVFLGEGKFVAPEKIEVGNDILHFSRALIATGTAPVIPDIPGIENIRILTNETLFSIKDLPQHLVVLGAGPIGCEMGQTFARFGSQVTLVEIADQILPREDNIPASIVEAALKNDGIHVMCNAKLTKVQGDKNNAILYITQNGNQHVLHADTVLTTTGRSPNVSNLGLESAGIEYDIRLGVRVNDYLQTTNTRVYAAGDVCSKFKFTHAADALARIVIRNALFFGRERVSNLVIPWCTYTEPEIAHVGLNEKEAEAQNIAINTITIPLDKTDRAFLDGESAGILRVHLKNNSDKILGATLVSRHAGESISEITALMTLRKGLSSLANVLHPYPTQSEIIKKAADAYNRSRLTPGVYKLFKYFLSWQ